MWVYRSRGELFKAQKNFIAAGLYAAQQLGLSVSHSNELDILQLTAKFQQRKIITSERNLLSYAENAMFYGSVLMNSDKSREALECFRFSNVIFQAKLLSMLSFILKEASKIKNDKRKHASCFKPTLTAKAAPKKAPQITPQKSDQFLCMLLRGIYCSIIVA